MNLIKPPVFYLRLSVKVIQSLAVLIAVLSLIGSPSSTASARVQPAPQQPAPLAAPTINLSLDMPDTIFLGDNFSFNVTFDTTGDTGYGPFIDLIFPVNGIDGNSNTSSPRDGFNFVSATYLGEAFSTANNNLVTQYFPADPSGIGCVDHPYARINAAGDFAQVCGPSGDRLVTLRLPFGSFTAEQPAVTVQVNATSLVDGFDNYADPNEGLAIRARGGFMFGTLTALDDWCCGDPAILQPSTTDGSGWPSGSVEPVVMTVAKSYNGPSNVEDETATGPNFLRSYTIVVDLADGETINNLVVTDDFPETAQFVSVASSAAYNAGLSTLPSTATPGGTLELVYNSVSADVTITVNFYIPRLDSASGDVVDPGNGDDTDTTNTVTAIGDWLPTDPRDQPAISVTAVGVPGVHSLVNKSIAVQKSVSNLTDASVSPGDLLGYTIDFQVSDFFAFGGLVVTDLLSDGQRVVPGTLTFSLTANPDSANLAEAAFTPANFDILCNYSGGLGPECTGTDGTLPAGTSQLVFRVSDEIISRGADAAGRMVGGCINPVTGSAVPNCSTYNNDASTGTITFQAQVQDQFTDDIPSGDASVDQSDELDNEVTIDGLVLDSDTFAAGEPEGDDATTQLIIQSLELAKNLYALNGSTNLASFIDPATGKLLVKPGDEVTYRLTYQLFTSDVEELLLTDYLPLPVFNVSDPDNDGAAGPAWSFSYNDFGTLPGYVPASGVVSNGPADTFYAYMQDGLNAGGPFDNDGAVTGTLSANPNHPGVVPNPEVGSNSANNRVEIAYGNYDDTRNQSTAVDLLITVTATDDPFADRLYLTNMAEATEGSTNATGSVSDAIVQIILTQPVLLSNKTVVWSSNTSAVYDQDPPVTFTDPSTEPRWTGTINNTNVDEMETDVANLDAGDTVTFAIVIQNTGSSLKGAFDITIQDVLQPEYQIPTDGAGAYPLNLQIYFGDGSGYDYGGGEEEIQFVGLGGGPSGLADDSDALFGNGIQLVDDTLNDLGICQAYDPTLTNDIIIITYDLYIRDSVTPGEIVNTESLVNYAGEEGGNNHLPEPQQDDATVDVNAAPTKILVATSEVHTADNLVAIGEIVRFQMSVRLPEATITNLQFHDLLPGGLIFLNDDTATVWFETNVPPTTSDYDVIPAIPNTCIAAAPCTLADLNISQSRVPGNNVDNYTPGIDPFFRLGNVINNDRDTGAVDGDEFVYVEFNGLVHNQVLFQNDHGENINNFVVVEVDGIQSGDRSNAAQVTVQEPLLTINKTHSEISATIEAGDLVTYTVTLENTGPVSAFDVEFEDLIPAAYLTLDAGSVNVSASYAITYTNNNPTGTGNTVDLTIDEIPSGGEVTITYNVTATDSVTPGQAIDNDASVTWTSLPGSGTTPNLTGSTTPGGSGEGNGERNGNEIAPNDYLAATSVSINVHDPFYSKSIPYSSEVHTTIPAHAVGEIATFGLSVTLPEGTTPGLQIVDDLPIGLSYVIGSAELVTANGQSAACPLANDFAGSFTAGDPVVTGAGGSGADVTFDFSTINVTSDGDDTNNTFLVCFEAQVVNETGVDNGVILTNSADFTINGVTDTQTVEINVVEPFLTVDKQASDETPGAGQSVFFTIDITHDAVAGSAADAFDVVITDTLPAELILDPASLAYTVGGASVPTGITDNSAGSVISYTIDQFPLTGTFQIIFEAEVDDEILTTSFDNTANLTWTSLPAVKPGERTGTGGVDDHTTSDTVTMQVLRDLAKSIISDNHAATTLPDVTIGELLTYQITVVVPPSSTDTFILTDTLDSGLAFVDCEDILAEADLSSSTIAFNTAGNCAHGTAGNPAISNQGGTIVFDLGTVTNTNPTEYRNITIRYQVAVLNLLDSYDGNGVTYANDVELVFDTHTLTATTPGVSIVEPFFSLEKTVDKQSAVPGDMVTFFLAAAHTSQSHTTGYDLVITDVIDTDFNIPEGGLVVTTVTGQPYDRFNYDTVTRTLTIEWDAMPVTNQSLVAFEVEVAETVRPDTILRNAANLEWTSLPGVPSAAPGQPEGVQSAYNPDSTERRYDPNSPANLTYTASSEISLNVPALPDTGFAPGQFTPISSQPADMAYDTSAEMRLVIPTLELDLPIVGVPLSSQGWNLTWLGSQAGYLEGTAYPTLAGNTGITAHVYTADGLPGPFVDLETISWGEEVYIYAYGLRFTYKVQAVRLAAPNDLSVLGHQQLDYLTLITCRSYDDTLQGYRWRTVVQAVLVSVEAGD
ncbi:MAG: DUF11 domain-containing protein [Anaerolineales bacterium]|nr:DUF11 domain-containing protein [Anaerolineales bacterium]